MGMDLIADAKYFGLSRDAEDLVRSGIDVNWLHNAEDKGYWALRLNGVPGTTKPETPWVIGVREPKNRMGVHQLMSRLQGRQQSFI
jgi:hypothetical protein